MITIVRATVLALAVTGSAAYVQLATSPSPQKAILTSSGYPRPTCMPSDYKNCPL